MHQKFEELIAEQRLPEQSRQKLEMISKRLKYFHDFTPLQKDAFNRPEFWDVKKHLMICGATSSGKTLVAEIAMLLADSQNQSAIYLSPLRAMVSEKYSNFRKDFEPEERDGHRRVFASDKDHQNDDYNITEGDFSTAVIVYEKFYALLAQGTAQKMLQNCGIIIFDEIQMIADEERGIKIIMSLLNAHKQNPNIRFVFMTTSYSDMSATEKLLQENMKLDICKIKNEQNSMALEEIVLCSNGKFRGKYSPSIHDLELDENALNALLAEKASKLATEEVCDARNLLNMSVTPCHDTDKREKKYQLLLDVIRQHRNRKIIVFINSRIICRQNAGKLAGEHIFERKNISEGLQKKLSALANTDQQREFMNDLMPYGIAYHHGGLSQAYRDIIEDEFSKEGGSLHVLFATETLAIGVNLPADVIVVYDTEKRENPEDDPVPIDTQTYKNYIGRAGRLGMTDASFTPRSYLLALSEAELDHYFTTYIDAQPTKIIPAYETMKFDTALPYFLSMLSNNDQYTIEELEEEIQKHMPRLQVEGFFKELLCKKGNREWPKQGNISNPRFHNAWDNMKLLKLNPADPLDLNYKDTYMLTNFGSGILPYALSLHDCHNIYQYMVNKDSSYNMILSENLEDDFSSDRSALSLLYFVCRLPVIERFNKFYVESFAKNQSKYNKYNTVLCRYFNTLLEEGTVTSDSLIGKAFSVNNGELPAEILTAALRAFILELWRKGVELDQIVKNIGIPMGIEEGDMERLADVTSFALEAISNSLPAAENDKIRRAAAGFRKLAHRVHYGGDDDIARIMSCHVYGLSRDSVIRLKNHLKNENICNGSVFNYFTTQEDSFVHAYVKGIIGKQCEDIKKSLSTRYAPVKIEKRLYNLRKDGLIYDTLDICLDANNLTLRKVKDFLINTADYTEMPYMIESLSTGCNTHTNCFRLCSSYISLNCAVINVSEPSTAIREFSNLLNSIDGRLVIIADKMITEELRKAYSELIKTRPASTDSLTSDEAVAFLTPEELLRLYLDCLVYRDSSVICNLFVYNLYKGKASDTISGSFTLEFPPDHLPDNTPIDVFISYSHHSPPETKNSISKLLKHCDDLNKNVFLDILSIPRGDNFVQRIICGLHQARTFVCLLDQAYIQGNWTQAEYSSILDLGISNERKVLVVCLDEEGYQYAVKNSIGTLNLIDARKFSSAMILEKVKNNL